ncbi:MAG TPA: TolC family protein [Opitutaceae bacterium]|jgi:outer membrane protein TolC|nr:TolC family protein [Opitutaceae bacterium]
MNQHSFSHSAGGRDRSPCSITHSPSRRWFSLILSLTAAVAGLAAQDAPTHLTLDDAIRLALANNRSIKVDTYSRAIGRASLLAAYGSFDPALTFNRSYSEQYTSSQPSADNGFLPPATLVQTDYYSLALVGIMPWGTQYSIGGTSVNQRGPYNGFTNNFLTTGGVNITQPLLRGFGFSGSSANLGLRVAKANRAISDWQYRQTVIDTITNVIVAYSDLIAAHASLRTAQRSRDLAAGLVAENEKRFKVGSMSENDVVSARAKVALREQGILFATQAVRDTDNRLRLLLGEHAFSNEGPLLAIAPAEPPELTLHVAEDLKKSYELRADFQQARFGLDKSRYNAAYARNQLLPQVDFVGGYGYTGYDKNFAASRRMVSNEDSRAYSAGVQVSVPLTFAQGRGNARAARLQHRRDEENLEFLKENIALSVTAAAGDVETTRKRVEAARAALDLAQKTLDAELKKLRAGTGTSTFVVLNYQDQLAEVEANYYQALADQRRAVAVYDREIGTTIDRYHIVLSKE